MGRELVADGCADEIRAIGIEAVTHQKIDRPEIDKSEVERQLFTVGRLGVLRVTGHIPSMWMLDGWYMDAASSFSRPGSPQKDAPRVRQSPAASTDSEMAPQRLEKIDSGLGNGASKAARAAAP